MKEQFFNVNKTLNCAGKLIDFSIPKVMGILNVTPDSFFDGGKYNSDTEALKHVEKMLFDGATFIDVGGYSSRPGAENISVQEETERVIPVIRAIIKFFPEAVISIDTFRSEVAKAAVGEGAVVVNDISGGQLDALMFATIAALKVPYILMHMKGTPQTMTTLSTYENLIKEVIDYFHPKIARLQELGCKDIIVDPGFGFAKSIDQNFELLNNLDHLRILGKPVLAGLSRKSMVWKALKIDTDQALNGTTSLNTIAILKGASVLRVHDVREAAEVIKLVTKLHA